MSRVGARVDELTAEVDDRSAGAPITVRGWWPGPAGVATLDLLGGAAELDIDVAEPDLLVSLRLHDPLDERSGRLTRILLGPTAATALTRARQVPGEPVVVWQRAEDRVRGLRTPGARPGGLGLIGRLGLGLAELTVPGRSDAAVAIGLIEAAVAAQDLHGDFAPQPDAPTLLRAGLARWEGLTPGSLDDVADRLGRLRGRWLKTGYAIDPSQSDRLDRLLGGALRRAPQAAAGGSRARAAEVFGSGAAADHLVAPMAAAPAQAVSAQAVSAIRAPGAPPIAMAFDPVLATAGARLVRIEREGHHLVAHLGGLPDDGPDPWVRVFVDDPAGPVPLALAPIPPTDRRWRTAVALVPTGVADRDLLVDVTVAPKEAWPSTTGRSVATAAHRGAEAARAARRGNPSAPDRWRETAESWSELGDDRRADLADAYAIDPVPVGPSISDLL